MGWFGKKKDPIKDRENTLTSEISQLEEQIRQLNSILKKAADTPKVTSTSLPSHKQSPARPAAKAEPHFEPVNQDQLQNTATAAPAANPFKSKKEQRTIQKEGSLSIWEKISRFFRGPQSSNPKLVSYLAAGNIHGLQPLRYEKRIHRNRMLLWVGLIVAALLGLIQMLFR